MGSLFDHPVLSDSENSPIGGGVFLFTLLGLIKEE
jgi:hypothetical protein